jgi:hypothetical protein
LCASLAIRLLQYFVVRIDHLVKEAQLNAGDKIVALKHALFDIYEFDPQLFKRLILLNSRELFYNVDPALTAEIEKLRCVALEKITSIFKIGVKKGIYICKQPDEMAEIIWAMFCGIVLWHEDSLSSGRKSPHLEKIMNRAFQIFERGALA